MGTVRRPAAIARCAGATDVVAGLEFARANGVSLAVRGGGHDYAGNSVCEGGLVIDLSPMSEVQVDPEARTVRVQAGAKWSDAANDDRNISWTKGFHDAMRPYASGGGVYVNLLSEDERLRVRESYGANCERLAEIKRSGTRTTC